MIIGKKPKIYAIFVRITSQTYIHSVYWNKRYAELQRDILVEENHKKGICQTMWVDEVESKEWKF